MVTVATQTPIVYLNGAFIPLSEARVPVLDRGFLFAEAVYEVIPVYNRRLFRIEQHLQRLELSLQGINLPNPHAQPTWIQILQQLIEQNPGQNQSVYLHITRGADQTRAHLYPPNLTPSLFCMSTPTPTPNAKLLNEGATVISLEDIRWHYRNLKTTALLGNVMLRVTADQQGADEAILIQDKLACECTSSNLFLIKDQTLITPPKDNRILAGITRDLILELAATHQIAYREQPIPQETLQQADELWLTSSIRELIAITTLDGKPVGNGKPGPLWQTMYRHYQDYKTRNRSA